MQRQTNMLLKQEILHLSLQPLEALADDDIWNIKTYPENWKELCF